MERFKNKTILIIGASSGIGKQTAVILSDQGAKLLLAARSTDKLNLLKESLDGDDHKVYPIDVSDATNIEQVIKEIINSEGPLDGMVYSAGISRDVPISMCKPDYMKNIFNTNFFGFVECVRQLTKKNRFNSGFRIVAVSSTASMHGSKGKMAYSASKAALNSAIQCMAMELSEKGICLNAVAPAMTNTEMYRKFVEAYGNESDFAKNLLTRQYLGIGEPEDIANAIAFLLSKEARFITGITLPVDGGATTS